MNNNFKLIDSTQLDTINGGFVLSGTLFTILGVAVTGTMCLKAGAAVGLVAGAVVLDKVCK